MKSALAVTKTCPKDGVHLLPLAYHFWNRQQPVLRLSAACEGVIGARAAAGTPGKIIDIVFMFGLIGGVGTSIGLSTPMLSAGLAELSASSAASDSTWRSS